MKKKAVHYLANGWMGEFGCSAVFARMTKNDFKGFITTKNPKRVTCKRCLKDMSKEKEWP